MIRRQYQKLMTYFYDPFMKSTEKILLMHRKELLQQVQGEVLEVGSGTGINFDLYPDKNAHIYGIEPSLPMYKKAKKRLQNKSNITLYNIGIENVLQQKDLPDQYDFIISMLVLCTVKDAEKAARLYYKLLKNNGKLLVLEHIHSTGKFYGKIQTLVNPLWKPFADGCNLTRRQDIILKNNGFEAIEESYFNYGTDWYQATMIKKHKS